MTIVWLIRHGESEANVGVAVAQSTELSRLTDRGHRQSQAIATTVPVPHLVVTSPYLRSKQTAQPTLQRFPHCPQTEWAVQEFDYVAFSAKASDRAAMLQLCKAYWQRRDPFYRDGDQAESFASLMQRVTTMLQQLRNLEGETVLIFSHSGFIRAVLWASLMQVTEITPRAMDKFCNFIQAIRIPNGAIVKLQLTQQGTFFSPILTTHLEGVD